MGALLQHSLFIYHIYSCTSLQLIIRYSELNTNFGWARFISVVYLGYLNLEVWCDCLSLNSAARLKLRVVELDILNIYIWWQCS